jgi:hypothetical protein
MKASPVLRQVNFGSAVAEQEPKLSNFFVETSSFWEVADDRVDVILGAKGAGKSAMARRLIDAQRVAGLEDVDVVPAFNLQGSVIFRRLAAELNETDEASMRTLWTVYMLALLGNHVVRNYGNSGLSRDVRDSLESAGLLLPDGSPKSLWSLVIGAFKGARFDGVEASLTATETGFPIVTAAARFGRKEAAGDPIDWEELLEAITNLYTWYGRRCWLVFDRLDEAFTHDPTLERIALRALLRTHMDLASYGGVVRSKLFLRTDLLDRITQETGFVNATHLRSHHLRWDHASMVDMVARRILESENVRRSFGFERDDSKTQDGRWRVCLSLIPEQLGGRADAFAWIATHSSDASEELNPRNVLTLLTEARSAQLLAFDRDDPELDTNHSLLSPKAMLSGFRALSKVRLNDTLYAEFGHLKAPIERLRGRGSSFSEQEFADLNHMTVGDQAFKQLVAELKYAGFIRQSPNRNITVCMLYRPALGLDGQPSRTKPRTKPRHVSKNDV